VRLPQNHACPPRDPLDNIGLGIEVDTSLREGDGFFCKTRHIEASIEHTTSIRQRNRVGSLMPQLATSGPSITIDVSITSNCPCPIMAELYKQRP
jgi:hypothetical protein